jgi:hypothetical protein
MSERLQWRRRPVKTTGSCPCRRGDPEIEALTATFGYHDGTKVLHETIQYLAERSKDEQGWLTALASAPFPVTVIWGRNEGVAHPPTLTHRSARSLVIRC